MYATVDKIDERPIIENDPSHTMRQLKIKYVSKREYTNDPATAHRTHNLFLEFNNKLTHLTNLNNVADDLHYDVKYIREWFSVNLGTKCLDNYVKTEFTAETISTIIYSFIQHFVLCPNCNLPKLRNNKSILTCESCQHLVCITDMDIPMKMKRYMSK